MKNLWLRAIQRVEDHYLSRMGLSLPLAVIVLVGAADLLAGRDHFIAPGMLAAPALASITVNWQRTALVCVLGAMAQAALAPYDGPTDVLPAQSIIFGQVVSYCVVSLFSVYIAWRRETRAKAFSAITSVAEAAQHALMHPPASRVGAVRLAVRYVSAAAEAQIGGDLYAVLETPYGVRALVGDVRGKGLGAVQTSAVVLGAFREAAFDEARLDGAAARVNTSLGRQITSGDFVTALFAQFDEAGVVEFLHWGHVPALRVGRDGAVQTLEPAEPWVPLGMAGLVPGTPAPWRVPLLPGDVLLLCTDGVVEARGHLDGTFYPLATRIGPLVAGCADDLDTAVDRLYEDLLRHTGGSLSDDVVLLLLAP